MSVSSRNMAPNRPTDGYIKASLSDGGGQCVLVRRLEGEASVFIRDSKYRRDSRNRPDLEPIIEMPATAWPIFEARVLDRTVATDMEGAPVVEFMDRGAVVLRAPDGTVLEFTSSEWGAFRDGLTRGEFASRQVAA